MADTSSESSDHFRRLMLKSAKSALDAVLGSPDRVVTLHTLRKQFGLKLEDFARRPDEFHSALVSVIGKEGAKHIEGRVMKWFYTSIGLEYRATRVGLPGKITKAKKDYDKVARTLKKSK